MFLTNLSTWIMPNHCQWISYSSRGNDRAEICSTPLVFLFSFGAGQINNRNLIYCTWAAWRPEHSRFFVLHTVHTGSLTSVSYTRRGTLLSLLVPMHLACKWHTPDCHLHHPNLVVLWRMWLAFVTCECNPLSPPFTTFKSSVPFCVTVSTPSRV